MALWVTVLCLGSDLACGRVTTGSSAKQRKHNWEQVSTLRTTEANWMRSNIVHGGFSAAWTQPEKSESTTRLHFELMQGTHLDMLHLLITFKLKRFVYQLRASWCQSAPQGG